MTKYRVFRKATPKQHAELEFNQNGITYRLNSLGDYQSLKAIKELYNIQQINRKSNGLKLTKPVVHNDNKLVIVKLA
jgi:hypothetical protein